MKDCKKFAIYSRKSRFTGKGESIENQIEMCKRYIRFHFPKATDDDMFIYEDEGFSGGNTNRPQFQKMMKDIKANKLDAVVCYRLDRISRNVVDFALMFKEFEDNGVHFLSVSENYETTTPSGKAMLNMCTVFAQMERETIAERIRDNMRELAKSGRWLGGNTPTGYRSVQTVGSVTVDGRERKAYRLDIIPKEAETVRLIFRKFLETHSLTQTETYLLQQGIKTKNGRNFNRFSIKNILQNPVYLTADKSAFVYLNGICEIYSDKKGFDGKYAVMAYNKTLQKQGRSNKIRSYDEWIIAVGKHKPLISSDDWIKAQRLLEQNRSKSYHKPKSNVALLSGLIYCSDCGSFMRPKKTKRLNSYGEEKYGYLCEMKEKSRMHNCKMQNPNGNELDKSVCNEIKKLPDEKSKFISYIKKSASKIDNNEDNEKQLDSLKKNYNENEKQIKSLVLSIASYGDLPAAEYIKEHINELHNRNEEIMERIDELKKLTEKNMLSAIDFNMLKTTLSVFSTSFDLMTTLQKRAALRLLIRRIDWDGECIHVYLFDKNDSLDFNSEPQCEYSK